MNIDNLAEPFPPLYNDNNAKKVKIRDFPTFDDEDHSGDETMDRISLYFTFKEKLLQWKEDHLHGKP